MSEEKDVTFTDEEICQQAQAQCFSWNWRNASYELVYKRRSIS